MPVCAKAALIILVVVEKILNYRDVFAWEVLLKGRVATQRKKIIDALNAFD